MTPQPWDWTEAAERLAAFPTGQVHALDDAVADLRAHVHAAGLHPSAEAAEAMWLGARLTIGLLAPLLTAGAGGDPIRQAHVQAHIDQVEEICHAARGLWRRPAGASQPTPAAAAAAADEWLKRRLLEVIRQLRDDHEREP